jgi:Protein of unknown function (DUF4229)
MTSPASLVGTLVAYTLARLCLVAAVAGLLVLAGVPLLLAVLIAVIAALPLSMLLLRGLRKQVDAGVTAVRERRSAQRAVLRARLRGDDLPDADSPRSGDDLTAEAGPADRSGDRPERQTDPGEHRPAQQ